MMIFLLVSQYDWVYENQNKILYTLVRLQEEWMEVSCSRSNVFLSVILW